MSESCNPVDPLVACQAPLSVGSPGKNTGMSCHFLFQGIFLTQRLNPGLLHCRQFLYQLSYKGNPLSSSLISTTPSLLAFYFSILECTHLKNNQNNLPLIFTSSSYYPILLPLTYHVLKKYPEVISDSSFLLFC